MLMSWAEVIEQYRLRRFAAADDAIEQYSLYRWAAIAKVLEDNLNDLVQPEFDELSDGVDLDEEEGDEEYAD